MNDPRRARYVALFAAESRSLLAGGRRALTGWREDFNDTAPADELFRVLHTIKGMAASLEFADLTQMVHQAEEGLSTVREGGVTADHSWLRELEVVLDEIAVECESLVANESGETPDLDASSEGQSREVVQVELSRLDALLADLGSTITSRQELDRHAAADLISPVARSAVVLSHRLDTLHQRIIQVRLAPLSEVLERIPPMVRDLARKLNKHVTVEVTGAEIELDRGILGVLPEPILHLMRNAVDHGIEAPDARRAAGKRPGGKITIRARQERDVVIVELTDDGRGIDRKTVAGKAQQKGMLQAGVELNDEDVLAILARPGFSTADQVTDISGRGVGLDTVMARLHAVGASLSLTTVQGHGTVFTIALPTRMGIVPALVTHVGQDRYVIPLTHVSELVAWSPDESFEEGGRTVIDVRGERVPVVDLRRLLMTDAGEPPSRRPAVILHAGGQRVALLADQVAGQVDAVMQPLERAIGLPRWITGATVLDDGQPALMLDLASVV